MGADCCAAEAEPGNRNVLNKTGTGIVGTEGAYTYENGEIFEFANAKVAAAYEERGDYLLNNDYDPSSDGESLEEEELKQLDSKAFYAGEWTRGTNLRHGRGTQVWPDGSMYQGWWKHDKSHGKGR